MRRSILGLRTVAMAALLVLGTGFSVPVHHTAVAADSTTDYCQGQCNDILPPGENGNATLADILANKALGTHPAHSDDQLGPYDQLSDEYGTLTDSAISKFFNSSSFGVPADQVGHGLAVDADTGVGDTLDQGDHAARSGGGTRC